MYDVWVLIRLTLVMCALFAIPLFLVLKKMARQVSEDHRLHRVKEIQASHGLGAKFAGFTVMILLVCWRKGEWGLAPAAAFTLAISVIIFSGRFRSRPNEARRSELRAETVWLMSAAALVVASMVDPIISHRSFVSPALLLALFWCVAWSLISRYCRGWRDSPSH
ncbi:hypothetical protein [Sphingomonas flavescens]|uniref:hypothetical protein n=1 Tax=Sphingomonas flavescens TaxID=3132797 RepID=UPI0028039868|nr:hypothetical protein [Sphingomonas limnosediminicola]